MGRRSSVKAAPDSIRSEIERLLRADKFSLDEMLDILRRQFPDHAASIPSRSSLGRYRQSMDQLMGRMREIDAASRAMVSEFGENPDDRCGALLTQAVTSLATHVALRANDEPDDVSIVEVRDLARAARNVMDARRVSLRERQDIEQIALKRQATATEKVAKTVGLSDDQWSKLRAEFLGIGKSQ